jgi:hypothetical protein
MPKRRQPPLTIEDLDMRRAEDPDALEAEIKIRTKDWAGYTFRLALGDDFNLSAVEILRDDSAAPLNSYRLQQVPIALFERAMIVESLHPENEPPEPEGAGRDDPRLAGVADAYVVALTQAHRGEKSPLDLVAERFPDYARSSIPRLVRRARERHLLTGTTKGSPGGVLTPKALALLGRVTPETIQTWAEADEHRANDDQLEALRREVAEMDRALQQLKQRVAEPSEVGPNEILNAMQDRPGGEVKSLPEALEGDRRPT